nr:C. briggsae CBR-TAG-144 protein [Haemonchus contortus]
MVQAGGNRRPWVEAASSAFAVASALPVTMNSMQIADLFEKVERLEPLDSCPLSAELSSLRNATGETLLIVAARANNVAAVKTLALDTEMLDESDNVRCYFIE